jgi:hypothetical protein
MGVIDGIAGYDFWFRDIFGLEMRVERDGRD